MAHLPAAEDMDMEVRHLLVRIRAVIGEDAPRIATICAISLPDGSSASLLVQLDLAGVAVSAGSACSSGKMKASEVLAAMRVPDDVAGGFIRVNAEAAL